MSDTIIPMNSTPLLLENLFKNFTEAEATAGVLAKYRLIYIVNNTGQDMKSSIIWTEGTQDHDTGIRISKGNTDTGTTDSITIPNELIPPIDVAFSEVGKSKGDPLYVGDWGSGKKRAVWIRLHLEAGADSFAFDNFDIHVYGQWTQKIT